MNIHTSITALDASAVLVCGVIWLAVATFLRLKKHRTFVYLLFFTDVLRLYRRGAGSHCIRIPISLPAQLSEPETTLF